MVIDDALESERKRQRLGCPEADPELVERLRIAAAHKMTPDEIKAQRVSFVWGNLPDDNRLTKEEVAAILDRMDGAS